MAEPQSVAQVMSALINKRKPKKALDYASSRPIAETDRDDANMWFMMSLSAMLIGNQALAQSMRSMAASRVNYTRQMEGDFHRRAAIALLKSGHLEAAMTELRSAYDIHVKDEDHSRIGADDMVRGRILLARKHYYLSVVWHNDADEAFSRILTDEPDNEIARQWLLNNRYHRLRSVAMLEGFSLSISSENYRYVIAHSKDRRQRVGARFAWYGRHLGVFVFDRLVEPVFFR